MSKEKKGKEKNTKTRPLINLMEKRAAKAVKRADKKSASMVLTNTI